VRVSSPTEVEITVELLPAGLLPRGGCLVRVRGELDLSSVDELQPALVQGERGQDLLVDLEECTFLDSSAIRTLLAGAREVESRGGRVAVAARPDGVLRTLEIAGVSARLAVHPSLEDALGAL
jgi:anti-anti-sigma factor